MRLVRIKTTKSKSWVPGALSASEAQGVFGCFLPAWLAVSTIPTTCGRGGCFFCTALRLRRLLFDEATFGRCSLAMQKSYRSGSLAKLPHVCIIALFRVSFVSLDGRF